MGGNVTLQRHPGLGYTINQEEILAARQILEAISRKRYDCKLSWSQYRRFIRSVSILLFEEFVIAFSCPPGRKVGYSDMCQYNRTKTLPNGRFPST